MAVGLKRKRVMDLPPCNDVIIDNVDVEDVNPIDYDNFKFIDDRYGGFISDKFDSVPYGNLLRVMTDAQLKELFEPGDVPTNDDFIAIIDSKLNKADVVDMAELEVKLGEFSQYVNGQLADKVGASHTHKKSSITDFSHRHNISEIDGFDNDIVLNASDINYVKNGQSTVDGSLDKLFVDVGKNESDILTMQSQIGTQISRAKVILASLSSKLD